MICEECSDSESDGDEAGGDREPHSCAQVLKYLGGVDISFVKDDIENACAAFVVVRLPDLEVCGLTQFPSYSLHKSHQIQLTDCAMLGPP